MIQAMIIFGWITIVLSPFVVPAAVDELSRTESLPKEIEKFLHFIAAFFVWIIELLGVATVVAGELIKYAAKPRQTPNGEDIPYDPTQLAVRGPSTASDAFVCPACKIMHFEADQHCPGCNLSIEERDRRMTRRENHLMAAYAGTVTLWTAAMAAGMEFPAFLAYAIPLPLLYFPWLVTNRRRRRRFVPTPSE